MTLPSIPQLDVQQFDADSAAFVKQFGSAYQEWGFAGITGHGIDNDLIKAALTTAEKFFALPDETKRAYIGTSHGANSWERGFIPFGVEKAKDSKHSDLKEFYHIGREHIGREVADSHSTVANKSANIWPVEVTEFRQVFEQLYAELDQLARRLLEAVALYLELPRSYFHDFVDQGEALLRVLHYPPIVDQEIPNLRAAAHEDINLMTLLVGSEQEGLEVLSRTGDWVPISMIDGTIICNVGDMLQRLSNAVLRSTTHRVVNPRGSKARVSRYSMPFFMHPIASMPLDCLSECVSDERPCEYEPITAGEYLNQRLNAIGLKPPQSDQQ